MAVVATVVGEAFIRSGWTPPETNFGLFIADPGFDALEAVMEGSEVRVKGKKVTSGWFIRLGDAQLRKDIMGMSRATRRRILFDGKKVQTISGTIGPFKPVRVNP